MLQMVERVVQREGLVDMGCAISDHHRNRPPDTPRSVYRGFVLELD